MLHHICIGDPDFVNHRNEDAWDRDLSTEDTIKRVSDAIRSNVAGDELLIAVHTFYDEEVYDWENAAKERAEALDELVKAVYRLGVHDKVGGPLARAEEVLEGGVS